MSATSAPSVHDLRAEFESILANVLGEEGRSMTADTMERRLLRQLLALGRSLLALFLATRAAVTTGREHRDPAGTCRPYHSERVRRHLSIFGSIVFARPYFYGRGVGGVAPVDAELSLPATACSDLVREAVEALAAGTRVRVLPYHPATGVLGRLFGLALSSRLVQEQLAEDAPAVEAYYAEQGPPPTEEEAAILVVQADGKGVPILRPTTTPAPVRLGKGQKYGGKRRRSSPPSPPSHPPCARRNRSWRVCSTPRRRASCQQQQRTRRRGRGRSTSASGPRSPAKRRRSRRPRSRSPPGRGRISPTGSP